MTLPDVVGLTRTYLLAELTPQERLEVMHAAALGYCKACGYEEPPGTRCQCENDD